LLDAAQQATAQSIHHLQPLYKTTFRDPHYLAPGLDHPATLAMLVRSTFPHVADAAFWDVQRRTQTEEHCRIDAAVAFERCSSRVTHLCDVLELSGDITIWGSQLLADLAGEVVRQRQSFAPSSDDVRLLARQDELDFRLSWRLRNIQPHERHVKILANAWVASASCPRLQDFALHIRDGQGLVRHRGRAALGIDRLASDADFRSVREDMDLLRNTVPNATKADYLLVAGDIDFAADAFVEEIMLDPDDAEPWAGLALVAALRGSNTVVFSRFPEILYAVHREIRLTYQRTVDPQELALWMTPFITYLDDTGCLVS
jgi:hypothetical protein